MTKTTKFNELSRQSNTILILSQTKSYSYQAESPPIVTNIKTGTQISTYEFYAMLYDYRTTGGNHANHRNVL